MATYSETQLQHAIRPGEIVVEIDNEHLNVTVRPEVNDLNDLMNPDKLLLVKTETIHGNRNQHFPPVEMRTTWGREMNAIRSRRVFNRDPLDTRKGLHDSLWGIDHIPGERIHLDIEGKRGRITDAIFDPDNDELYQKLRRIGMQIHGVKPFIPGEAVDRDLSDPYLLWGWAYHMRKIMDGDTEHNGGPEGHRGCATSGPRLCRPVQNVDLMPSLEEIIRSCRVRVPFTRYHKAEAWKEWDEIRKANDPDYSIQNGDTIVLTPWLAGFGRSKQELETVGSV